MKNNYIYNFSISKSSGNGSMKEILGGKGANLAQMCLLGIPVPPGFTISTEACSFYYNNNKTLPDSLKFDIRESIKNLEQELSAEFGNKNNPLLISVRSGARVSMPGMMDTILNLGLNDETITGLISFGGERFAYDSYRRFIQMYSSVVLGVEHYLFEEEIDTLKLARAAISDLDLSTQDLISLVDKFKKIVKNKTNQEFPQDSWQQLEGAIKAVFDSWHCPRAIIYRKMNNIPDEWGTAVNVQAMVFGNMGETSCTGVAFTRNPSTGENSLYGEYLVNAQGEDVVAGLRTPQSLTIKGKIENGSSLPSMEESMPKIFAEFCEIAKKLEEYFTDMQDIEFTVQQGKLWILQTRSGKRTIKSAIKIAADLTSEGKITKKQALLRINPHQLDQILHPTIDPQASKILLTKGLPASPGAASGSVVFSAEEAERRKSLGEDVILVRVETSPEDIHGMYAAKAILTSRGGMTSHAAVVARGMGKPCICAAEGLDIDYKNGLSNIKGKIVKEGEPITIDGASGEVFLGIVPKISPEVTKEFAMIMNWADEIRTLDVRANAETTIDVEAAIQFGAQGIGLCRTEHMFFEASRIISVRKMILATNQEDRAKALAEILPMQKTDFTEIFRLMKNLPVTIRLLDPPLHEFLPNKESEFEELAQAVGRSKQEVINTAKQLHEANPMLGHRGCRLAVTFPEIYEMQAQAIFDAMVEVQQETGLMPQVEIMIPLVATHQEISMMRQLILNQKDLAQKKHSTKIDCSIGTMIELPRAALTSDKIAEHVEFMSFGTNDLTQTTFGLSRDDSGSFIPQYRERKIFEYDPFVRIDEEGVGQLIKISLEKTKSVKENIKLGICGEHGGNPESIDFCHRIGFDYVSCSPYRIPTARLSAARSAIIHEDAE